MGGTSEYAVSVASGTSSSAKPKLNVHSVDQDQNRDDLDVGGRSSIETAVFGVLFTLSKENSETRIVIRWVLLKVLLDGWQLFTTVVHPDDQGWDINTNSTVWKIVNVLSFDWLSDLGYSIYVLVLYCMVSLLAVNILLCAWVAWCFKEQKFPVVWPIKVLRIFSSVFFQAFDIASLNLLQIGIACNFTGPKQPHMHLDLFPARSCAAMPQIVHTIVSAVSLVVFIALALLTNMAEVEVNPRSRRPMALGHSGAEVAAFAIKVLMTLVDVFIGWRTVAACCYTALAIALAWQYLRWCPHLVGWVNHLKAAVAGGVIWCCAILLLLVFEPGVSGVQARMDWQHIMTLVMLIGMAPAAAATALLSWWLARRRDAAAAKAIKEAALPAGTPLIDVAPDFIHAPRDVEILARCCRVWVDRRNLDKDAVGRAQTLIKAGLALFPGHAFVSLVQANFMIDVLGVGQSGRRQIEAARKLNPGLMARFVIFVRAQQAQQRAAGNNVSGASGGANMDLLGYVEYQRKQRMVVRLHREALQAMCLFWKALDSQTVSFTALSKSLAKIDTSVSQAQAAYRLVLETYGNSPRLVRLYGKFLEFIKNDPWGAAEFYAEAERLEQLKNDDGNGPQLPDGTPLSRMDELSTAVLVVSSSGEIQMANKQAHNLFGYRKGDLDGKPMAALLAPHSTRRLADCLSRLVESSVAALGFGGEVAEGPAPAPGSVAIGMGAVGAGGSATGAAAAAAAAALTTQAAVLGMHRDRMALPLRVSISKASGAGEDSTFIALLEPVHCPRDTSCLWVTPTGAVAACDPSFVATFGFAASDVVGSQLAAFVATDAGAWARRGTSRRPTAGGVTGRSPPVHAGSAATIGADAWGGDVEDAGAAEDAALLDLDGEAVSVLDRLVAAAEAASAGLEPADAKPRVDCRVTHRYASSIRCLAIVRQLDLGETPLFELRLKLASPEPLLLLVSDRKGGIRFASPQLAAMLCPRGAPVAAAAAAEGGAAEGGEGGAPAAGAGAGGGPLARGLAQGYTLRDFMPQPWRDMHVKLLRDVTGSTTGPPGRAAWSCRNGGGAPNGHGPTLELRTSHGQPLYMHVAVGTTDMLGEQLHVVRMARSSVGKALTERRVQLAVSANGRVTAVSAEAGAQPLFGFEAKQMVGHSLWEVVEGLEGQLMKRPAASAAASRGGGDADPSTIAFAGFMERVLRAPPGRSWRVTVVPPSAAGASTGGGVGNIKAQMAAARRAAKSRPAVMVVHILDETDTNNHHLPVTTDGADGEAQPPAVLIELWPMAGLSGVLELDSLGRVTAVLEETVRPAGHLFGLPFGGLVGENLSGLVCLPQGKRTFADLLSAHGKKSSLKSAAKDTGVKTGPLHVLQATHADGRALALDVQVVGRAGHNQTLTVLLHPHAQPLQPSLAALLVPAAVPPPTLIANATAALTAPAAGRPRFGPDPPKLNDSAKSESLDPVTGRLLSTPPAAPAAAPAAATAGDEKAKAEADELALLTKLEPPKRPASRPSGAAAVPAAAAAADGAAAAPAPPLPGTVPETEATKDAVAAGTASGDAKPASGSRPTTAAAAAAAATAADAGAKPPSAGSGGAAATLQHASSLDRLVSIVEAGGVPVDGADGAAAEGKGRKPMDARSMAKSHFSGVAGGDSVEGDDQDEEDEEEDEDEGDKKDGDRAGSDGGDGSADGEPDKPRNKSFQAVSKWVETKGAVFHNTAPPSLAGDDDAGAGGGDPSADGVAVIGGVPLPVGAASSRMPAWKNPGKKGVDDDDISESNGAGTGARNTAAGYDDAGGNAKGRRTSSNDMDDAASDGGASAMSGQSAASSGGAVEYKRGKRFRNLVKLMDSSQAEHILLRFKRGALLAMLLLAIAHIVCFALVVTSITEQQHAMGQLVIAGRSQRLLHQTLVRVRALDQIQKGKAPANLYGVADVEPFAEQILEYAQGVKELNNLVVSSNVKYQQIANLYYYSGVKVWTARNATSGEDIFTNVTLWDMATKVFTSAKDVYQNYEKWKATGVNISSTPAGQFLLKSGADLFTNYRMVLDSLLFIAMDNTASVNKLQLACLLAEGCGVSVLSALLLAYLLRSLALQRYTLYGTDDEEPDDDEEEERKATSGSQGEDDEEGGDGAAKTKAPRRAAVVDDSVHGNAGKGKDERTASGDNTVGKRRASIMENPGATVRSNSKQLTSSPSQAFTQPSPRFGGLRGLLMRCFPCCGFGRGRRSSVVFPDGSTWGGAGSISIGGAATRRALKRDSSDTLKLLAPFVLWSCVVVVFYVMAVVQLQNLGSLVAVASVTNFNTARTYRAAFFAQELASEEDPTRLPARKAAVKRAATLLRDAFYTLQLGSEAYQALGPATERFPLVTVGLSRETPEIESLFYSNDGCLRRSPNPPCEGEDYRYYQVTHSGVDSMMQVYLDNVNLMSDEVVATTPGLTNPRFDFIYNVGTKDLTDANVLISELHFKYIIDVFNGIMLLHILLFVLLWVCLAAFFMLLLNPLVARYKKEKRRIAELMSQLPLELDVEKLVGRALGAPVKEKDASVHGGGAGGGSGGSAMPLDPSNHGGNAAAAAAAAAAAEPQHDAGKNWKMVLRSASQQVQKQRAGSNGGNIGGGMMSPKR
ncbi:hypothetical protein HYH03_006477 [Edaphochlamys debaryana]|uniref:PAS domain-containing protein n=1 Tax=Edaphochlamys debaryana TaxID=47281 RepID=A0A836C1H3_9CHLO|nr:hypothetical protein HYH03_006477 [Edaphochlamys debaryana]|eukprot:KAG2495534.1 hypothetical protein HYH03_006477 [Edaphochlamys debaryana]